MPACWHSFTSCEHVSPCQPGNTKHQLEGQHGNTSVSVSAWQHITLAASMATQYISVFAWQHNKLHCLHGHKTRQFQWQHGNTTHISMSAWQHNTLQRQYDNTTQTSTRLLCHHGNTTHTSVPVWQHNTHFSANMATIHTSVPAWQHNTLQ